MSLFNSGELRTLPGEEEDVRDSAFVDGDD